MERAEAGKKRRVKRGWDKIRLGEGRSERDGFLIENPTRSDLFICMVNIAIQLMYPICASLD
ncbi:hypothetical protein [Priestia megaterium]|uniref:hypothetical protein n=1 Tax=Priestia megaterium TaxID=1404 RepID=UPI000D516D5D|nr:hypothetical protein [Priestia megaterium]PVE70987.1 hypothetical protein DC428_11105 [Priestia megaterium]PVE89042.1 hypothetical protein DC421_02950 [Priestia megaterium]PVE92732.1 hypothetical protein DC426_04605 [Priestia megaterium]PVF01524.1 hypothetical protein DC433_00130 [Priestia megaterium]